MDQFIAVTYKFFNNQAPIYMEDVLKSSPQIAVRVLHMNLSCIYHLGNMTMVKTVFHIGEQLFGMA